MASPCPPRTTLTSNLRKSFQGTFVFVSFNNTAFLRDYHVAGYQFNFLMSNEIQQANASAWANPVSQIAQTTLVDPMTLFPVENFSNAIEKKFADLSLSILSDTRFNERINISTTCTVSAPAQMWEYRPFWLILSYSLAVGGSLLAVSAGAYAIWKNGYGMESRFSTLLATTRNPDIDRLMEGYSLGRAPLPKQITKNRFRFGEISGTKNEQDVMRVGFGPENTVGQIIVGKRYY